MKDFTPSYYREIIKAFTLRGYKPVTVKEYFNNAPDKCVIIRHDVDRLPLMALNIAKIEFGMNIKSTFYFRIKRSVFKENILNEIKGMGHEIGYHYNDYASSFGRRKKAINSFKANLEMVRRIYPVETICMHGSPLTPWNNLDMWLDREYAGFGITAELNKDINYDSVFYLTDNGLGWNQFNTSLRDKVNSKYDIAIGKDMSLTDLIKTDKLPPVVLLNSHPDNYYKPGVKRYIFHLNIKTKNAIKWILIKSRLVK